MVNSPTSDAQHGFNTNKRKWSNEDGRRRRCEGSGNGFKGRGGGRGGGGGRGFGGGRGEKKFRFQRGGSSNSNENKRPFNKGDNDEFNEHHAFEDLSENSSDKGNENETLFSTSDSFEYKRFDDGASTNVAEKMQHLTNISQAVEAEDSIIQIDAANEEVDTSDSEDEVEAPSNLQEEESEGNETDDASEEKENEESDEEEEEENLSNKDKQEFHIKITELGGCDLFQTNTSQLPITQELCEIIVRRIPRSLHKTSVLSKFFAKYGKIENITLSRTQTNILYSIIRFDSVAAAQKSLEVHGMKFGKSRLLVNIYDKCVSNRAKHLCFAVDVKVTDPNYNDLWDLFETCGPIYNIHVNKSQHCAMVFFENEYSLSFALDLDGTTVGNEQIRVTKAVRDEDVIVQDAL